MSIYSALNAGINGVLAQSNRISTISDNLSNSGTVGYKRVDATFSSIVSALAGTSPGGYTPGGVESGSRLIVATSGLIRSTSSALDLAVSGDGFFIVNDSTTSLENLRYTRAGSFSQDLNGYFVNDQGFYLKGWALNDDGSTPTALDVDQVDSTTALAALSTVNVSALTNNPIPTTNVSLQANLKASELIYTDPYDPLNPLTNMASNAIAPHFERPFNVIDNLGVEHQFNFGFLKTGVNTWQLEIYAQTPADVNGADGLIASGQITFNGDGTPAVIDPALTAPITIDWTSAATDNVVTFFLGTAGVPFGTPNATVVGRQDGIYQLDTDYLVNNIIEDGQTAGSLESIRIDKEGYVVGVYNNNTTKRVFKIPLAQFLDPSQLLAETGNVFAEGNNTATATFRGNNQSSIGAIFSAALENSNVDLSSELVELIIAQRAYQSNTSVITASDELLQRLDQAIR